MGADPDVDLDVNLDSNFDAAELPAAPGAYLLGVRLGRARWLRFRGRAPLRLEPGLYVYAGSARGPGGVRARVARHLRRDKKPHWHVDSLTAAGRVIAVAGQAGGSECALLADLARLPGARVPAPGFGSSDCRTCPAHLVQVDDLNAVRGGLGPGLIWMCL